MSPQANLLTFLQVVPVCHYDASLETLGFIFSQGNCEQVVIVNSQYQPLGMISLRRFLPYLLNQIPVSPPSQTQPSLGEIFQAIIEPVIGIPSHLNLQEFWIYLQYQNSQTGADQTQTQSISLALVNQTGEFIGLIDSLQVLDHLVKHSQPFPPVESPKASPLQTFDWKTENSLKLSFLSPKDSTLLNHLIEFLSELPIPLMIQQNDGTIISQNLAWRSLIGRGAEVVQEVAEAVTRWTETPELFSEQENGLNSPLETTGNLGFLSNPLTHVAEPLASNSASLEMPQWCQFGNKPDTYICICPVTQNQERVWQFTRQRLNPESEIALCLEQKTNYLWLVLAQDITEQHRVAQELTAKNTDLIQLNRIKDEFMACISHELKTPLTAILGLSSLLKDQVLGELNERQTRYAQLIHKSGRHLMLVVNDILDLTRIETGQLELVPEPLHIHTVCQAAFDLAIQHYQSQDKSDIKLQAEILAQVKRRFHLEIEPGLETFVADELRLRQMLVNLLCNALKFAPDGSDFGLQVSRWENWVAFTIWDQGIGIPDDKQHLIFQKFQQLESPLTREFEGTGLGLVLTQHLARLHGGDVSFISKPNQGSKFTLLLPPNPPRHNWELRHKIGSQDSQFSTSTPVVSSEKSRLVLIVETVPQFIQNLSEQLTDLGYRVVVARSGTEAVEKARCLQPRAILLNPLIPLLSGWDVLTLLKTDLKTHQIPVIVTATLGDKQRAKMNHCDGFLRLPVQGLELEKMLAELLPEVPYSVPQQLIILWLSLSGNPQNLVSTGAWENKNYIYHSALFLSRFSHCRILEVDDISQASIMAQIWHPNVMVLERDSSIQNPSYVLREISQQESLARLPIVTLDPLTTQVANQVENLSIFPCLANSPEDQLNSQSFPLSISSALLEVVQIATRLSWKPSILVVDSSVLHEEQFGHLLDSEDPNINPEFNSELILGSDNNSPCNFEKNPARLDRINDTNFKIDQALVQYMEIAGFQGIMGKNWEEIIRKIQCKSLDLILICFRGKSFAKIVEALSTLEKIESKIPIIILAQSDINILNQTLSKKQGNKPSSTVELEEHIWKKMAIYLQCFTSSFPLKVLPFNLSVDSLLEEIKVLLTHPKPYK